jgi:regulation of enolase protein 1 (concanavalin A-like superfamily)
LKVDTTIYPATQGPSSTGTPPPPPSTALPASWSHQDIGAVGAAGDATYDSSSGTFTVKGAGADVWGTADALHYAYTTLTGDGSIVARVVSISNTAAWVKAGLMIRASLDAGSAQAFMLVSYSKGLAFQRRTVTGGTSTSTAGALAGAPYWVRLDRSGDVFTAYQSADGVSWTAVGTDTIPMGSTVYIGLGVSSHTTAAVATGLFDNVTITP